MKFSSSQALYRGFRVRKAYLAFLEFLLSPHATHYGMGNGDDDVSSNFDYDEEIDLGDFEVDDNNLLNEWRIAPTPQSLNRFACFLNNQK